MSLIKNLKEKVVKLKNIKSLNKKGVSEVVSSVLLILLVLSAIVVIGAVIMNFIERNSEGIDSGSTVIGIEIVSAQYGPNGLEVRLKRSPVPGEVSGVNLVINDESGNSSTIINNTPIDLLETKPIYVSRAQLISAGIAPGNITKITAIPIISTGNNQVLGRLHDELQVNSHFASDLNLVAHYPMEGNGNDIWRYGYHGHIFDNDTANTDSNSPPILVPGKFGNALDFNGTDDNFQERRINETTFNNSYSISGWFNYDGWNNTFFERSQGIVQKRKTMNEQIIIGIYVNSSLPTGAGCPMLPNAGNRTVYLFGAASATCSQWLVSQTQLQTGQWYHFVTTYDALTNNGTIYINSMAQDSKISLPMLSPPNTNLSIASPPINYGTGWSFFDGRVDEIRIYNRTLSQEEVNYLYKYN